MIDKQTFLQAFIVHLQVNQIPFKEKSDHIHLSQSNQRFFLEMIAYENGTFETLITDLGNGSFAKREQGEWVDANDLKARLLSYQDILNKAR
ncbi:hypothetical protein [Neisseria canis]|uniref:Uncharacterized protein n=1 Tax=Neisseria canis TaxID=493 RepID=A0A448D9Z8_9NEIS|nr:hypothetical protein [Neisseria canis]OSI12672.1 hypothetical protein BWD07_04325 [Neisseria canis]VEF02672.1 Uncharacterised protein [Neisseria canis]